MKELSDALLALELMPEKVRHLACNPTAGARYQWSYTAALSLIRHGYPFRLIEPLLEHYRGRPDNWAGELRAQIGNATNTILSGGGSNKPAIPAVAFTSTDADRVWSWLKEGRTFRALTASSPSNPRLPAEEILRLLFPNDPYVCVTLRSRDNQVKGRLSQYSSDFLRDCSFVVASTFATAGRREDDKQRCRAAISRRRAGHHRGASCLDCCTGRSDKSRTPRPRPLRRRPIIYK